MIPNEPQLPSPCCSLTPLVWKVTPLNPIAAARRMSRLSARAPKKEMLRYGRGARTVPAAGRLGSGSSGCASAHATEQQRKRSWQPARRTRES